ncbi:MAG: polymer-forming cytoskeletal protein [Peptococcaceae bacterium]|jgi:cytoskeletal protein CcmA (bactofilin family)|nr:polymer-forming cytoskeletal protein [Peptococcaceae bacterium]
MNTMKFSGITQTDGGVYQNVKIEGVAKINGDITCEELSLQGVSTFKGDLTCTDVHIEGTCKIAGDVKSRHCRLSGLINVGRDLEAESFTGRGALKVGGSLNAEKADIRFVYGSSAHEVCGQQLKIQRENANGALEFITDLIPWRHKGKSFRCALIEGDDIDVEHVTADTVRGKNVRIGAECQIRLVEYHETVSIHPQARVESTVKLEG